MYPRPKFGLIGVYFCMSCRVESETIMRNFVLRISKLHLAASFSIRECEYSCYYTRAWTVSFGSGAVRCKMLKVDNVNVLVKS